MSVGVVHVLGACAQVQSTVWCAFHIAACNTSFCRIFVLLLVLVVLLVVVVVVVPVLATHLNVVFSWALKIVTRLHWRAYSRAPMDNNVSVMHLLLALVVALRERTTQCVWRHRINLSIMCVELHNCAPQLGCKGMLDLLLAPRAQWQAFEVLLRLTAILPQVRIPATCLHLCRLHVVPVAMLATAELVSSVSPFARSGWACLKILFVRHPSRRVIHCLHDVVFE